MIRLALLSVFFCLAFVYHTQAQQPVCCTSPQWHGEISSDFFAQSSNASNVEVLSSVFHEKIEYDATNQRIRIDVVEWDQETGQTDNYTQIFLYQTGKYYLFYGAGQGTEPSRTCVATTLRPPFDKFEPACVDGGFKAKSALTIGGPNADRLTIEAYTYSAFSAGVQISPGCWPVSGVFFQHQKQLNRFGRIQANYFNLQMGVSDESFTIPSTCSSSIADSCQCGCNINGVEYCCPSAKYKSCSVGGGGVDCVCSNGSPCTNSC